MRFLIDVCVSHRVVEYLLSRGHDLLLVEGSDPRMADEDILHWAAKERRVLITNDRDFGPFVLVHSRPPTGLMRLPHAPGHCLRSMVELVLLNHGEDLVDSAVITVSRSGIRVRRT